MISNLFSNTNKSIIQIGRKGHSENDFELEGAAVSRKHCTIEKLADGNYKITDLHSKNGTFINGELLSGNSTIISNTDIIAIGKHILCIGVYSAKLTAVHLEGLEKVFSNGKVGFHKLSLSIAKEILWQLWDQAVAANQLC